MFALQKRWLVCWICFGIHSCRLRVHKTFYPYSWNIIILICTSFYIHFCECFCLLFVRCGIKGCFFLIYVYLYKYAFTMPVDYDSRRTNGYFQIGIWGVSKICTVPHLYSRFGRFVQLNHECQNHTPYCDRILILSYPKTGTKWLLYIKSKGESYPKFKDMLYKIAPVVIMTGVEAVLAQSKPRFYSCHIPCNFV